jgi:uncharacterized protein (DUF983 family)
MKPFVRDHGDDTRIAFAVVVAGTVVIAGEMVTELAYLPLYAFIAIELVRHGLRRSRKEKAL